MDLLPGLDGRSASARRFRDLVNAFVADMGRIDCCSEIRLGLLRRLAATTVQRAALNAGHGETQRDWRYWAEAGRRHYAALEGRRLRP
jgi:hypothetical protein